jgi:hypothetical protein
MAEPDRVTINRRVTAIDTLLGKAGTASQPGDAPTAHADSHGAEGSDAITPAAIGAQPAGSYLTAVPAVEQAKLDALSFDPDPEGTPPSAGDVLVWDETAEAFVPEAPTVGVTSAEITSIVALTEDQYTALDPKVLTTLYITLPNT